jgi:hypothetical protein
LRNDWLKHRSTDPPTISWVICAVALACLPTIPTALFGEESPGIKPLLAVHLSEIHKQLPPGTHVLIDAASIEQFLHELDGAPPDWAMVYGHGHHDPAHDERLFTLNRKRDAKRAGNEVLYWRIAFVWSGELSRIDPESGGFPVVLGPRFTSTSWGQVRFKYDDLPGNLIALPSPPQREILLQRMGQGQSIEIDIVMVGTLIPEESIVYDFSHDQEGLGLIMPVVRVEEVVYLLSPTHPTR